jgi:hypothetical protein
MARPLPLVSWMTEATHLQPERYVRAVIGIVGLATGILGWFSLVNSHEGALALDRAIAALAICFIGFASLGAARTSTRPYGPVRLVLGVAIALSLRTILSMPIPPRPETIGSDVTLGAIILIALSASLLLVPRNGLALGLLAVLGALGVLLNYGVARYLMWSGVTPAINSSAAIMAFIGSACMSAIVLALPPSAMVSAKRRVP